MGLFIDLRRDLEPLVDEVRRGVRPRPVISPFKQSPFAWTGKLHYYGVERVDDDELRRLLIKPKNATAEELAAWQVEHKRRVTSPWLLGQTMFRSIFVSKGWSRDMVLRECLEKLANEIVQGVRAFVVVPGQAGSSPNCAANRMA
jgi:hypothetical protein